MTARHLLPCITLSMLAMVLVSCAPYATDPYYTQTAATRADPAYVNPHDIVGTWYDAWVWNGHQYRDTYTFYSDYTGVRQSENVWRDGGGLTTTGDLQWAYDAHGGWNVRLYNQHITSGTGRIGEAPYVFQVRKVNGRIYYDKFKRTWVNANDAAMVGQKNGASGGSYQNRQDLHNGLQQLQTTLQTLSSALN
jgi:hypothetical protein